MQELQKRHALVAVLDKAGAKDVQVNWWFERLHFVSAKTTAEQHAEAARRYPAATRDAGLETTYCYAWSPTTDIDWVALAG